jgi:hypothetical protein
MFRAFYIILIPLFLFACDHIERFDNQFENYADLTNSKAWKGGWVPKIIPKDAFNIKESHYIDRTSVILSFDFSDNFKSKLDEICNKKNAHEIRFSDINAKWWPNSLVGQALVSSHEYYYYSCKGVGGYFAIPFGSKKAYYWRP